VQERISPRKTLTVNSPRGGRKPVLVPSSEGGRGGPEKTFLEGGVLNLGGIKKGGGKNLFEKRNQYVIVTSGGVQLHLERTVISNGEGKVGKKTA